MVDAALVDAATREARALTGNARRLRSIAARIAEQNPRVIATVVVMPGQDLDDRVLGPLRLALAGRRDVVQIVVTVAANGAGDTDPGEHP